MPGNNTAMLMNAIHGFALREAMCDDQLMYAGLSELRLHSNCGIAPPYMAVYLTGIAVRTLKGPDKARTIREMTKF